MKLTQMNIDGIEKDKKESIKNKKVNIKNTAKI